MLVTAALRRWGQAVYKFQANLDIHTMIYIVRPYLKQNKPLFFVFFFKNPLQTVYTYAHYIMHIRYFQMYSLKSTAVRIYLRDFNIFFKGC